MPCDLQCPGSGLELPGSSPGFFCLGCADALYEDGGIEIDNNAAERRLRVRTTCSPGQPVNCIEEPMPRILKAEAAAPDPS
jgi:hypothetical protein